MKTLDHKKTFSRLNTPLFSLMAANFLSARRNFSAINRFINHDNLNDTNYWEGEDGDLSLTIMIEYLEIKEQNKINELTDSAYWAFYQSEKNDKKAVNRVIKGWRKILSTT